MYHEKFSESQLVATSCMMAVVIRYGKYIDIAVYRDIDSPR